MIPTEKINPFENIDYLSDDPQISDYSAESSFSEEEENEVKKNTEKKKKKPRIRKPITEKDTSEFEKAVSLYFEEKPLYFNPPLTSEEEASQVPGMTVEMIKHRKNSPLKNANWNNFAKTVFGRIEREDLVAGDYLYKLKYLIISLEKIYEEQEKEKKRQAEKQAEDKLREQELAKIAASNEAKRKESGIYKIQSPKNSVKDPNLNQNANKILESIGKSIYSSRKFNQQASVKTLQKLPKHEASRQNSSNSLSTFRPIASSIEQPGSQLFRYLKQKIPNVLDDKSLSMYKNFLIRQPPSSQIDTSQKVFSPMENIMGKIKKMNLIEKWKSEELS